MALSYPVHQHLVRKVNLTLRPQRTSLTEINNGKFQQSTPQMKKSEEHQQIGWNH